MPVGAWSQVLIIYANEDLAVWLIRNLCRPKSHMQFGPGIHYASFLPFTRQLLNYVFLRLMQK